jgi:hypothetical protein
MSSAKDLMVGEKPLASLRVIDLKEELEKRGLPKSGSKKDLADRLKNVSTSVPPASLLASFPFYFHSRHSLSCFTHPSFHWIPWLRHA